MEDRFDVMILGLAPQGLFLLRELCKTGQKVIAVGLKGSAGLHSKYGYRIAIKNLDELEEIFSKFLHEAIKVNITSDPFLNYLVDREHDIFHKYQCMPNYKSATIFSDKLSTEKLARKLGICCQKSFRLNKIDIDTYDTYPSIVKWNRRYVGEKFKTILIRSVEDLRKIKFQNNSSNNLIVQRYIPGRPDSDVSYGGYFSNGAEQLYIIIKQKRQYPYPNGLASFVEEYHGKFAEEIWRISKTILKETNYSGFVEVEFRIDKKDNKVFLLEVNPRACGWIKIIKRKYGNLFTTQNVAPRINKNVTARWVNIARDLGAIIDTLKKNPQEVVLRELLSDYLRNPIRDIFEFSDPIPFICQFRKLIERKNR